MSLNAGAITGTIGLDTAPLNGALRSARNELDQFQAGTGGVFGGLPRLINPTTLAIAGVGAAIAGIGAGIFFGGRLAAEAEQAEVAFGVMLGSADEARAVLAELNQFAASTPFEMPGLTDAARRLLAFGSGADQVIPELRAIGDISAGIGAPISEIAELYGKARVQGRLMAEDINQLTGRGIPIIGELAKQFGVAESEVKGLVSQGAVGFPDLQRAFVSMTSEGGQFAGLMAAQSVTLNGLISTLKDNVGLLARDLTAELFDRIDLKGLIADFTSAIPVIKGVLGGVLDLAINGIGAVADMLGIASKGGEESGNSIVDAMRIGARGVAFVADMIDAAVIGYDLLRLGATKFLAVAAGGISDLVSLAAGLPDWLGGGVAANVAEFAEIFEANLDSEISKLSEQLNQKLIAPSRGDRVLSFFDDVRRSAEAAAEAASGVGDSIGAIEIAIDPPALPETVLPLEVDGENLESQLDEVFAGQKLAGLNLIGSNEELQLRSRQRLAASGAPGGPDPTKFDKQQVDEQKGTNKRLDAVASLLRQMLGNDPTVTIPGL